MIDGYILQREELANLFLLIDGEHKPMQIDLQFIRKVRPKWGAFFRLYLQKADKLSRTALNQNIQAFLISAPIGRVCPLFITSERAVGREEYSPIWMRY